MPAAPFLKYDPKDVVIIIGGFIYGPAAAFCMSAVVSLLEMVTVSDTGPVGAFMNMLSTCSIACSASLVYKESKSMKSAVIGLAIGTLIATAAMVLCNILITPAYMGVPRAVVSQMIMPVFVPFNLIKGGLNSVITILVLKGTQLALVKKR